MIIMRTTCTLAAIVAASAIAPGLVAQTTGIPDSLRYLGLPDDPDSVPNSVTSDNYTFSNMFAVGCPSGGGWPEKAYNAVLKAAETDFDIRTNVAGTLGAMLGGSRCPSDQRAFEHWMADRLRGEWQAGLLHEWDDDDETLWPAYILWLELGGTMLASYNVLREIACDGEADMVGRDLSAVAMEMVWIRLHGDDRATARDAVAKDIGFAGEVPRETKGPSGGYWVAPPCR